MKWLIVILTLIVAMAFTRTEQGISLGGSSYDTVPSGVPQLFGGKYYKFNGYVLTDSFIMNAPGDTNNIPRYPSLKFKSSDNRWYGWDRTKWQQFATQGDLSNQNLQQVTDNGNITTDTIIAKGIRTSLIIGDTTDADDYEFDVFPDLQGYSGNGGVAVAPMDSMFNWVARNRTTENIKALIQVGDLTNVQANLTEMGRASAEFDKIDALSPELPYLPIIGNHDYTVRSTRDVTGYDSYFGPARYAGKSFYGGNMNGSNANFFVLFEAGGHQYAAIGIEFLPRDTALNWAQKIIDSLPDREIILVTHAYIARSGERSRDTTQFSTCAEYSFSECNNGEQIWQKLVKNNKRIFLVLSGHFITGFGVTPPVVKRLTDAGAGGNVVYQIVCNYQQDTLYGNGYFMRMKFKPRENKINVSFYSPYLGYNDARFPTYDLSYPAIRMEGAVGISDSGGGLSVAGEARFDSSVKITGIPLNYVVKNDLDGNIARTQIIDNGTDVTVGGGVVVPGIASGATAPTTTGITKVVVSDATGRLSFRDSTTIAGNSYIKNQNASVQTAKYFISGPSITSSSGQYRALGVANIPATFYMTQNTGENGMNLQQAGSTAPMLSFYHTTNTDINIRNPTATGDVLGHILWSGNNKTDSTLVNLMGIRCFARVGTFTGGEFTFNTRDTAAGVFTDRMHLTSTGDLRLGGNATTLYRLHIQSGNAFIAGNTYAIGNLGVGTITPTARLHLPAGTTAASTAPLKFTTGANLSTPEDGAVEYDGVHYYGTIGSTRYQLDQQTNGITSINSKTGPAITLASGAATIVNNAVANQVSFDLDPTSSLITHTIDAIILTAQNTGTGETDLYSKSIAGVTLSTDKQTINFEADGEFNDNTATAQLKLYFGGNVTLNTGAIVISTANTAWRLKGYIIRTSSTTAHVTYELQTPGLATPLFIGYSNLTSLDFTTPNIFKITAQAGGVGGGTGDITAHSWQLLYKPEP